MRTTIAWTEVAQDDERGEGPAVKFSCAQVVGWGGAPVTIGSIEKAYENGGWDGAWSWRPWCPLGSDLVAEGMRSDDLGALQRQVGDAWLSKVVGADPPPGRFAEHLGGAKESPLEIRWGDVRQVDQTAAAYLPWGRLGFAQRNKQHSSIRYRDLEWAQDWRFVFNQPLGHLLTDPEDSPEPEAQVRSRLEDRWAAKVKGAE